MSRLLAASTIAFLATPAFAQFRARPAAKVEFTYFRLGEVVNYYESYNVKAQELATLFQERLFPATFLRTATEEDKDPYVITVRLEERSEGMESKLLTPAWFVFGLRAGPGRFSEKWQPPLRLKFELFFGRRGGFSTPSFKDEVDKAATALGASPGDLIDGLLCYIPVFVRDEASAIDGYYFQAQVYNEETQRKEKRALMGLPLWQDTIGLMPQSKFLLEVVVKDGNTRRTVFHVVTSTLDSTSDLCADPEALPLQNSLAVQSVTQTKGAGTEEARAAAIHPDGDATPPNPAAGFGRPLSHAKPCVPLDYHSDPNPNNHIVETRRVYAIECVPMDAANTSVPPSGTTSGVPSP